MIVNKITTGFVIQQFDTELKRFINQEFIAGDECDYEDQDGNPVGPDLLNDENGREIYLPFEMAEITKEDIADPLKGE